MGVLAIIATVVVVSYTIGYCCGIHYIQKAQQEMNEWLKENG